ncbi:MAG: hypothetical protein Q8Q14_01430 [Gemmatimonadales bacterium]|nr:hypothetical protein [Gemmatimonadales bacterium]
MDAAWWVTTAIAGWGAILATILAVRALTRAPGRARVGLGYTARAGAAAQPFVLAATISNRGREPIFLAEATLDTRRIAMSTTRFATAPPLPVEVKPGQSYTADFEAAMVWAASSYGPFREVRVLFRDQRGRSYASEFLAAGEPRQTPTGWTLSLAERPTVGQRLRAGILRRHRTASAPGVVSLDQSANALAGLAAEIEACRAMFDGAALRVYGPRFLQDSVVIRYLHGAVATAEVMEILARARHPAGAEPLARFLFETALDLMYLLYAPDAAEAAARTVAWNLLDRERGLQQAAVVAGADPNGEAELRGAETADEVIEATARAVARMGGDAGLVRRVYADAKATKPRFWHWSNMSRTAMINHLEAHGAPAELVAVLRGLWSALSDAGHPSPRWHNLRFDLDPEAMTMTLPDSRMASEEEVAEFAERGRDLLHVARRLVEQHRARAETEQRERKP